MRKPQRMILPILLIAFGLWLLAGCLFIPTFDKTIGGQKVSDQIGNSESNRPLKIGHASRQQVVKLLGEPHYIAPDGGRIAYTWKVLNGIWVWPLCFDTYEQEGARAIILHFDQRGVLESFHLERQNGNFLYNLQMPPVPYDMKRHQPPEGMWYDSHLGTPTTHPAIRE